MTASHTLCYQRSAEFEWLGKGGPNGIKPSDDEWLVNWLKYEIDRDKVEIRYSIDPHAHLRGWKDLNRKERRRFVTAVKAHAPWASHVLGMPNTTPKLFTGKDAKEYAQAVYAILYEADLPIYDIIPCIYLTEETTPEMIYEAAELGVKAAKLYPAGVTTGSDAGVLDISKLHPVLAAMTKVGMILCVHGETVERIIPKYNAERVYVGRELPGIVEMFPNLTIILEHITTKEAVEFVKNHENVFATITVHHLFLVFQDVLHDRMQPDHFCLPVAKFYFDRHALLMAAVSGNPKFMLGTDSAPHVHSTKYCASCCAGIFSATVAPELLVELFIKMGCFDKFDGFCTQHAADVYNVTPREEKIRLVRRPHKVPMSHEGIAPFWKGRQLEFQIEV